MDETETGSGGPAEPPTTEGAAAGSRKRRRGSRGGQRKRKPAGTTPTPAVAGEAPDSSAIDGLELPELPREGRISPEAAERALVRKPQIGDTRPAPRAAEPAETRRGGRKQAAKSADVPAGRQEETRRRK